MSSRAFMRKIALNVLYRINPGNITIRHPYTKDKFWLHSFRHRSYWYYGKKRECKTMQIFSEIIRPGDFVVELGGHIGYLAVYFAHLVGPQGKVLVFEPGPNNLPYVRRNVASYKNTTVVPKAVSDFDGQGQLYIENLTGANDTLCKDFPSLVGNLRACGISGLKSSTIPIECITLDSVFRETDLPRPSVVKIDVEGAELSVLRGMDDLLRRDDVAIMIEVTQDRAEVYRLLEERGYVLFNDAREPIKDRKQVHDDNVFCFKRSDPRFKEFSRSP
jgi:FkbM family methyltransferase